MSSLNEIVLHNDSLNQRDKSINKRLVKILNYKMFKGYRDIKKAKEFYIQKPKYQNAFSWKNKVLYPFEEYYNLEYKKKNLSSYYSQDLSYMLQVDNYSKNKEIYLKKEKKEKCINIPQKKNKFRKKQIINIRKKPHNDSFFYFSSKSSIIKNDSDNNKKKQQLKLYRTIFCDENEIGLYNDIPIFAIEEIQENNEIKKQLKLDSNSKKERINDLQFLYKVSHEISKKIVDFRNRYTTLKSATQRKTTKNSSTNTLSYTHRVQSAKPNETHLSLKSNNSATFNITIKNNKNEDTIINHSKKRKKENIDSKSLYNTIINRAKNNKGYFRRNKGLVKNNSFCHFRINKHLLFNNDKEKNKMKPKANYFPNFDRFVNEDILINIINLKKKKFEKLKNLMEN